MASKSAARTPRAARSRSPNGREGDDGPRPRTVIRIPGIRADRTPMRGGPSAMTGRKTDAERRRAEDRDAGAISDQEPRRAEVEGGFLRRAGRRPDKGDRGPDSAAEIGPPGRDGEFGFGAIFATNPLPSRSRGGRSLGTAGAAARWGGPAGARIPTVKDVLIDRRGLAGQVRRPIRLRYLAAAAGRGASAGVRHGRARRRCTTRRQHRTHECRQGDPWETGLAERDRHDFIPGRMADPLSSGSDNSS
jgi:hypothetical protein